MENNRKNSRGGRIAVFGTLKVMVSVSLLVAMSIVLGKYLAINVGEVLRFSFENLPIIISGMLFGPIVGLLSGVAADLIGCMLVGYAVNPLVTLGAATIGFSSGLCYLIFKRTRLPYSLRILLPIIAAHILGSVLLKTLGLSAFYDMPFVMLMLWRALNYLIIGAIEYVLIYFIMKNKAINAQFDFLKRG